MGQGTYTSSFSSLPADATFTDNGVLQVNWNHNSGSIPSVGYLPFLVQALRDNGYLGIINIYRRGTTGHTLQQIQALHLANAISDCKSAGNEPNLIVVVGGTNNSDVGESALVEYALETLFQQAREACPFARIIMMGQCVIDPGPASNHTEGNEVIAISESVCSRYNVIYVNGQGETLSVDNVHLAESAYQNMAIDGINLLIN